MSGPIEAIEKALTKQYRKRVARRVFAALGGTVAHGAFAGLVLARSSHLSPSDLALKALGLYEAEVVDVLTSLGRTKTFVDLGAGDGFYPIALTRFGFADRALAFELQAEGRAAIRANAEANGVAERIGIFGAAGADLAATLKAEAVDPASLVLLCDIEGAEYAVIDDALLEVLSPAHLVVELHPFAVADGAAREAAWLASVSRTHEVSLFTQAPRDWRGIAELEALGDYERALVMCEGRKAPQRWLHAWPRTA